jgi:hypothetical protein
LNSVDEEEMPFLFIRQSTMYTCLLGLRNIKWLYTCMSTYCSDILPIKERLSKKV